MLTRVYLLSALCCLAGLLQPVMGASDQPEGSAAQQDTHATDAAQSLATSAKSTDTDERTDTAAAVVNDQSESPTQSPTASEAAETAGSDKAKTEAAPAKPKFPTPAGGHRVYVVPIEGPIGKPQLFILRRALKDAISNGVTTVILQMDTPGGRLDTTLEMMEALDQFEGETITYVDPDAISAGSYIAVACDAIYFSPKGKMGAAEAVSGSGQDIDESMQRKINSYLRASVRVLSETHRYRADVQRAMMDPNFELEIDGDVIKPEGELLTLTAREAVRTYGDPAEPLLAAGIADSVEQLLNERYGEGNFHIEEFHLSWSEEFAKWFSGVAPLLISIGVILIIIEIKTPNFGLIGGIGIALVVVAFLSNYFAGLAGNEPILLFLLGVVLIVVELFFLPGTLIMALLGLACVCASIVWTMSDIWPTPDGGYTISSEALMDALQNALLAFVLAGIGLALVWRFLPGSSLFKRFISVGSVGGVSEVDAHGGSSSSGQSTLPDLGAIGTVVRDLHPQGVVEIDGQRYQARCTNGDIRRGQKIIIVQRGSFALVVEPYEPQS